MRGNLVLYPVLVNLVLDIARLVCCLFAHVEHALNIDEYQKEGNKVKYIRATDIYDPFLVGAEAGYLISGVNDPNYDATKDNTEETT